jgi:NADPH:quinone reductase-like Zn-dependent oxidoreductase
VLELTGGHGADVVVDVGGKSTLEESVAFWGQISIVGGLTGYDGQIPAARLLGKSARAQGIFVGSRADFARMNAFIVRHRLHPAIDRVVPLEQYADALKQLESGNFVGKIVLRL